MKLDSIPTNSSYINVNESSKNEEIKSEIKSILNNQLYGILATSYNHQPYTNLIAFIASEDTKNIFLATGKETQKYYNLNKNKNVAFFIDTRSNDQIDIINANTLTAMGQAKQIKTKQINDIKKKYLSKHPLLKEFINSKNVEIFGMTVYTYIYVKSFQQVFKLKLD